MLVVLLCCVSGIWVYWQYFYRKNNHRDNWLPGSLRFLSILGILILLFNPKILDKTKVDVKTDLLVLADNSTSIDYSGYSMTVKDLVRELSDDPELNQRFDLKFYHFGEKLVKDSLLDFSEQQTNIHQALNELNTLSSQEGAPVILITDGNQTFGSDYAYTRTRSSIFPVVIGDTLEHSDLAIDLINTNSYANLGNNFSVEIFVSHNGNNTLNTRLIIENKGKIIYESPLTFTSEEKSKYVELMLPAEALGMQLYQARLIPFEGELNQINNLYDFGVEIIDEKSKVAVIYETLHPDLGMIKRSIESHQQREAVLMRPEEWEENRETFSIHILYQPVSSFKNIFKELTEQGRSYFIITGAHTDWNFLNQAQGSFRKENSQLTESFFPVYRQEFNSFFVEDIEFSGFPPLSDKFGTVRFNVSVESLLEQQINGINTKSPMLFSFKQGDARNVVLFGEGIWKWRKQSFLRHQSNKQFDQFFNSLIQYLNLHERKEELELIYQPVYHANERIVIQAKKYDSNLNLNERAQLVLKFSDASQEQPLYLRKGIYEVNVSNLEEGKYDFELLDLESNQKRPGSFKVVPYSLEQAKTGSNIQDLRELAQQSNGNEFYPDQIDLLKDNLLKNAEWKIRQKEEIKMISLIDWKWLLGLIVLSLTLEWLIRKYRGLV